MLLIMIQKYRSPQTDILESYFVSKNATLKVLYETMDSADWVNHCKLSTIESGLLVMMNGYPTTYIFRSAKLPGS